MRLRVVVTDAEGRVATMHRHVAVHDDPDLVAIDASLGVGTSSPVFVDLNGDGADELVVATDDGMVHARRVDGSELPGFPLRTPPRPTGTGVHELRSLMASRRPAPRCPSVRRRSPTWMVTARPRSS